MKLGWRLLTALRFGFVAATLIFVSLWAECQTQDQATLKKTVAELNIGRNGRSTETGAGFLVGVDAQYLYFLTAYHVVKGASSIDVHFLGSASQYRGELLDRVAQDLDAAVVRVARSQIGGFSFPFLILGSSDRLRSGSTSTTIGHPGTLEWSIAQAVVARTNDPDDGRRFLLTRVQSIEKGNSGGPVFDGHGYVVGMVREVTSDFIYVEKIETLVGALKDDSWRVPTTNLRSPVPDFNGSWSDGVAGHVVRIETNGDTALLRRYNGPDEVDVPQGTIDGRHLHATFKLYGVNNGGEIDLTLSPDGQRLTGTTGAPRMGYGSQSYILTRLDSDQLAQRGAPSQVVLSGNWSDGQPADHYFEFSFDGYTTSVTKYGAGRQFIYKAPVSIVGRTVRFSIQSQSGPMDVECTVSSDNLIMEGKITIRSTGVTQAYRLDKVFVAGR